MSTKKAPTKAQHKHANKITHRHPDGKFKQPPGSNAPAQQPPPEAPNFIPDITGDYQEDFYQVPPVPTESEY